MPLLSNYFKISDTVIGIISLLGDIGTCLIIVFATSSLMFFMCKFSDYIFPIEYFFKN